jgi:hypothetical protein
VEINELLGRLIPWQFSDARSAVTRKREGANLKSAPNVKVRRPLRKRIPSKTFNGDKKETGSDEQDG